MNSSAIAFNCLNKMENFDNASFGSVFCNDNCDNFAKFWIHEILNVLNLKSKRIDIFVKYHFVDNIPRK